MAKFEDLKGQKFGYWTVVERAENHPATRSAQWLCECECGTKKIIRASALKSGKSKSCGCHKNDYNKIHGGTIHKICRYIEREGSDYRVGERGGCWRYSYMQCKERPDIREERLQNCAKDWLDYLAWCKELKYDLTNMFFYFPKNFKKVHDRTAVP